MNDSLAEKERRAIEHLKSFEPRDGKGYYLCYKGQRLYPLYQCGESRIGCIGCPMQGFKGMKAELAKYPIYRANYVKAFDRMLEVRKRRNLPTSWETGEDVMRWWVGDDPRQITLEDMQ